MAYIFFLLSSTFHGKKIKNCKEIFVQGFQMCFLHKSIKRIEFYNVRIFILYRDDFYLSIPFFCFFLRGKLFRGHSCVPLRNLTVDPMHYVQMYCYAFYSIVAK